MKKLIVNADDLGLSRAVSLGIEHAHRKGIVSSATLMANMPGFEEGVRVALDNPALGVGVHLNIIRGRPLLDDGASAPLLENGRFLSGLFRIGRICTCPDFLEAAEREYRAQIERVLDAGVKADHLDFEKHHGIWRPLYRLGCRLASDYGMGIRCYREPLFHALQNLPFPGIRASWLSLHLHLYQRFFHERPSVFSPDYFFGQTHIGHIDTEFLRALVQNLPDGVTELMCHPGYRDSEEEETLAEISGHSWITARREEELEALTGEELPDLLSTCGVELTTYGSRHRP